MTDKGYTRLIRTLEAYGKTHALSMFIIAFVIYLNFHYIIGAVVAVLGCILIAIQILMSTLQHIYLGKKNYETLTILFTTQFYLNQSVFVVFIGVMIWAVVYMLEHQRPTT